MQHDIRGNPLPGASSEDAQRYNQIMQDYMEYRASVFKDLKQLCIESPDFVMAHIFKGYMLLSMGSLGTVKAALGCLDDIDAAAVEPGSREQLHIAALQAWARGDTDTATTVWEQILLHSPHDMLALKLHHFALFWMGQADRMLDICARLSPHWDQSVPGYGHYIGMLAFAREETGDYGNAERDARLAIAEQPQDLWAIHALAHVFEMQGRLDEGLTLLDYPRQYFDDRNPFRGHLWWHQAMFMVEAGALEHALETYDHGIYSEESVFYLDVQNTAAMLARLELAGLDVGERWQQLSAIVEQRLQDHVLAFTEPHHTIVLGRCGRFDLIETQLQSLSAIAESGDTSLAGLIGPLLLPLCRAIRDFYLGNFTAASGQLEALQYRLSPIGGSHAQRDLFNIYLINCTAQQGELKKARALLDQRLFHKPRSRPTWQMLFEVCRQLNDTLGEERARLALAG